MSARVSLALALSWCLVSWAAHAEEPAPPAGAAAVDEPQPDPSASAAPLPAQVVESLYAVVLVLVGWVYSQERELLTPNWPVQRDS